MNFFVLVRYSAVIIQLRSIEYQFDYHEYRTRCFFQRGFIDGFVRTIVHNFYLTSIEFNPSCISAAGIVRVHANPFPGMEIFIVGRHGYRVNNRRFLKVKEFFESRFETKKRFLRIIL